MTFMNKNKGFTPLEILLNAVKSKDNQSRDYMSKSNKQIPKISKRGFTLIEILIVVAIIGILSSVVLVGLSSFRARGRDAKRIADLRETQNALELYYAKYSTYPNVVNTWADLRTLLVSPGTGIGVSTISDDPLSDSPQAWHYGYGVSADGQRYVIGAQLEDSNNAALNDSIHNTDIPITVNNVSGCATPVYCVQF